MVKKYEISEKKIQKILGKFLIFLQSVLIKVQTFFFILIKEVQVDSDPKKSKIIFLI